MGDMPEFIIDFLSSMDELFDALTDEEDFVNREDVWDIVYGFKEMFDEFIVNLANERIGRNSFDSEEEEDG